MQNGNCAIFCPKIKHVIMTVEQRHCWSISGVSLRLGTLSHDYYLTAAPEILHLQFLHSSYNILSSQVLNSSCGKEVVRFHIFSAKCGQTYCLSLFLPTSLWPGQSLLAMNDWMSDSDKKNTLLLSTDHNLEISIKCVCVCVCASLTQFVVNWFLSVEL